MPNIPIEEQANVPGGLMSLDPGTVPGQRPPNFGKQEYSRLPPLIGTVVNSDGSLHNIKGRGFIKLERLKR